MPAPPRPFVASALLLLALLAGSRPAAAGWSADTTLGTPLCLVTGDVLEPLAVSDGAGGFIVMWTDFRKPGFDPDFYCTRVSAAGDTLWPGSGVVVCNAPGSQIRPALVADGHGGAFMAWMDLRTSGGSQGYYVQHIDANGVRRWAPNGINPVGGFNAQYGPKIALDGSGGIFLAFASGSPGTQIQRLDSLGVKKLGSFPPAEGPLLRANFSAPLAIVPDGSGGAIVALGYGSSGISDLAAQRVTSAGALLWTSGGAPVCVATGSQGVVDMISDEAGGAVLAWEDGRAGSTNIYAQRLSATGAPIWTVDGIPLRSQTAIQSGVQLRALAGGAAIAVWRDYRDLPATDLVAQRLGSDGSLAWPGEGMLVCSNTPAIERYSIVPAGVDSTIVVWNTTSSSGGDAFAQALDGSGVRRWGPYGATVCRGPGDQTSTAAASDGAGGVMVVYRDGRVVSDPNLHAQHLGVDGSLSSATLGVPWQHPMVSEQIRIAPNPARELQRLTFARPLEMSARVDVIDLAGRRWRTDVAQAGARGWTWDGRDDVGDRVPSGVYHIRVRASGRIAVARVVRLD